MKGCDVKKVREKAGLSQSQFCEQYGLNLFTLRQWERKDTELDSAVASYMKCIKRDAEVVKKLLHEEKKPTQPPSKK